MSFLAPFYLVLAAAAGVPLMLHLMRRNLGARVEFPAARYLQRAEQEHSRSLRLRNLLLMLLRVLLILALAIAAARPFVRGIGAGHGPTAVAVVLDNSLSTTALSRGAPVFDRLRDAATALLRAATPGDRLWLVTADGRVRGGDREQLLGELQRITPSEGAGDLPLALRRAAAAVQGAGVPARVVAVATDGQRSAWAGATRLSGPLALLVPEGDTPLDRAVVAASAEPARWTPRGTVTARVESRDSAGFRVLIGDRTLARGTTGRGQPIAIRAAPPERGWRAGRVELDPDDYRANDVRHFALWIGPAPSVSADPSAGPFAATALGALVADGRATMGPGVRIASADAVDALPALITPPADPARLGAANRALARLGIPWRFGPAEQRSALVRGARLDGIAVSERHALAREGAAASDTIATAGGEPWVVAGPGYVLVASRLDPAATTLPVRAPFVPWLSDMLGLRLAGDAGDASVPLAASPSQHVVLPQGADALESESGARRIIAFSEVPAPDERGVWFVLRRGRRIGALVVEAPAQEGALARWDAGTLANRLGGRGGRAADTPDAWVRATFAAGTQRPALTPLLVLALLLLVVETVVVRAARSTRSSRATAA